MQLIKGTLIPIGGNEDKGIEADEMYTLEFIEEELPASDERDEIVTFIRESGRGIIKRFVKGASEED